jgi:hypothetical protein
MLHRVIQDLPGPVPVDPAADVAHQKAMIERGERRLALLDRLTDMAMSLAEALHRKALERIESGEVEDEGKGARDPLSEFNKTAQTLRRTIALEAKLAAAVKAGREKLLTDAAQLADAQDFAKTNAVIFGFHDAWAADCPKKEYDETVERLMEDAREHIRDVDEFRGYLDRPVGETVERLCAAVGLDPGACERDGDVWIIRRPPTEFETHLPPDLPNVPPPCGEGGSARPSPPGEGVSAHRAETGGEVCRAYDST